MPVRVQGWKANDGSLHTTEAAALIYEGRRELTEIVARIADNLNGSHEYKDQILPDHRDDFEKVLHRILFGSSSVLQSALRKCDGYTPQVTTRKARETPTPEDS